MLLKRATISRLFLGKATGSNEYFTLIDYAGMVRNFNILYWKGIYDCSMFVMTLGQYILNMKNETNT